MNIEVAVAVVSRVDSRLTVKLCNKTPDADSFKGILHSTVIANLVLVHCPLVALWYRQVQ